MLHLSSAKSSKILNRSLPRPVSSLTTAHCPCFCPRVSLQERVITKVTSAHQITRSPQSSWQGQLWHVMSVVACGAPGSTWPPSPSHVLGLVVCSSAGRVIVDFGERSPVRLPHHHPFTTSWAEHLDGIATATEPTCDKLPKQLASPPSATLHPLGGSNSYIVYDLSCISHFQELGHVQGR